MAEQTISMNHNSSKTGLLDPKPSADVLKGDSSPPYNNNNDQSDAGSKSAGTQGNNADGVQAKTSKFQITSVNPKQPHHSDVDVEVENDSNDEVEETFSRKNATAGVKDLAPPAANNAQTTGESRFQIVKIETSEPFHRGRFKCMDYRENTRDESRVEDQNARITEINREMASGSGTSSTSSSLHYVPGEHTPSDNPIPVSGLLDDKGRENLVAPKPHYPPNPLQQPVTNGAVPGALQTSIPQKPQVEEPKQQSPPAAAKEQVQEQRGGASEDSSPQTQTAGTTSPIQTISDLEKNLRASLASPEPTQSVEIPRFQVVKVAESEPESKLTEVPSTAAPEPEPVLSSPPSLIAATLESSGLNPPNSDIDNKIEQAMDLVKSHLMMAVREEVEELKLKIQDLMKTITDLTEKNSALEKENRSLRAQATPEPQSATPDAPSLSIQQPSAPSGAVQ